MKKLVYLFLFLLLGSSVVSAQTNDISKQKSGIFKSIGVFAGGDYSGLSGDAPQDAAYARKFGFLGGVSVEFNITKDIKLLLQPMYNIKNSKLLYDIGETELYDSLQFKFEYIRVPLLAKINAFNGVTYFLSGVDFGYLLKSTANDKEKITEKDISSYVNKFDLAALFGVGVNFKVKSNDLYLELRYSQSLLNMSNNSQNKFDSYLPTRFRLMGFQLLTGFNFNL
jgi:hypothetical protein